NCRSDLNSGGFGDRRIRRLDVDLGQSCRFRTVFRVGSISGVRSAVVFYEPVTDDSEAAGESRVGFGRDLRGLSYPEPGADPDNFFRRLRAQPGFHQVPESDSAGVFACCGGESAVCCASRHLDSWASRRAGILSLSKLILIAGE